MKVQIYSKRFVEAGARQLSFGDIWGAAGLGETVVRLNGVGVGRSKGRTLLVPCAIGACLHFGRGLSVCVRLCYASLSCYET